MAEGTDREGSGLPHDLFQASLDSYVQDPSSGGQNEQAAAITELESITLYQSNQMVALSALDADTIAFIGIPPQQADQTSKTYVSISRHFEKVHKIHSSSVATLGSAKFESLLGPSSQFRAERRLKNAGILPYGKPANIKYLLDLRPPREGDDAIFLITELSCSRGILDWFKARNKYNIPTVLVSGQDDSSLLPRITSNPHPDREASRGGKSVDQPGASTASAETLASPVIDLVSNAEPQTRRIGNWEGDLPKLPGVCPEDEDLEDGVVATETGTSDQERPGAGQAAATKVTPTTETAIQAEYSQLRHWSAIERLLHAIEGKDPMLDSAPKVWTYYAIANYFGCANNEYVNKWITQWLFKEPNHHFIQCNPEVCYRIGLGIQSEALIKDAFSLLVGEKALMIAHRQNLKVAESNLQVSVAGRKLGLLDDDELNRIEHAAHSFTQRIQQVFDDLTGERMQWLEASPIYKTLADFVAHTTAEQQVARNLKNYIKSFVRSRVMWALARDYRSDPQDMEQDPESVRPFYPCASAQYLGYNKLSKDERILSRFFWMALKNDQLGMGDSSIFSVVERKPSHALYSPSPMPGWSTLAKELRTEAPETNLLAVKKYTLDTWSERFEDILHGRSHDPVSKVNSGRDWWMEDHNLAAVKPNLQAEGAGEISLEHDSGVESAPFTAFHRLLLSSPKRERGTNTMVDAAGGKRLRLDLDETRGDGDLAQGRKVELPFRAAISHAEHETIPQQKPNQVRDTLKQVTKKLQELRVPFVDWNTNMDIELMTGVVDSGDSAAEATRCTMPSTQVEKQREHGEIGKKPYFSVDVLLIELTHAMRSICEEVLFSAHLFHDSEVPTNLIGSLTSLTQKEWDFLPLWAGGNDDGSGGVFDCMLVPNLETGGFGAGELGRNGLVDSADSGDWSMIGSTVGKASKQATDGTATETATVQSLDDVEMDVRSVDDAYSVLGAETVVVGDTFLDASLEATDNDGAEWVEDEEGGDDVEVEDVDGGELEDSEDEGADDSGWDDFAL